MGPVETYARGALTFDVLDAGPADGEIVLLLHGFPQTPQSWDRVAPHLHAAGYRTLAPAQRGYSPGARPVGRRAYAVDELVEDARALIDAAGVQRAHVVGHDWGAAVAWGLAAAHPDRVASLTALSVPHTAAFLRAMVRGPQLPHSWYMLAFQVPGLAERAVGPGTPGGRRRFTGVLRRAGMPGDSVQRSATVLADPGAFTAALGWYRAIPFGDPKDIRAKITVPTTFVWSDGDSYVTRAAATACGRFVEAPYRFEILRGVDHWIPEKAADLVSPIVVEQLRSASAA